MTVTDLRDPVRLTSPADIVATLPHLLGFTPDESIVVVALKQNEDNRRQRLVVTGRVDADTAPHLDTVLASVMAQADPTHLVIAAYRPNLTDAHATALAARESVLAAWPHLVIQELLAVTPERYRVSGCDNGTCCPPDGWPLPDTTEAATTVAAATALDGRAAYGSREDMVAALEPTEAATRRILPLPPAPDRTTTLALFSRLVGEVANGQEPSIIDLRPLSAALAAGKPHTQRDAILSLVCRVDDRAVTHLATRLLILTQQALPDEPMTLATLAAVAYVSGDGAMANVALDRLAASGREVPSLALLVQGAIEAGMPPTVIRDAWGNAPV